jgi:thiamine-phosphate pyrophosphorylase
MARAKMTSKRHAILRGLYAISPEMKDTARLVARIEECLAGGVTLVQYRAKSATPALALEQARRIGEACRANGAALIVNDSVELAVAADADGVHLGRDDMDVVKARGALRGRIIGVSCYDEPLRARAAREAGADYVAIGSVFRSATKPDAVRASLENLTAAKEISRLPLVAIGGINLDNASLAIAAGADMVAVIEALFGAPDVRAAARSFMRLFEDQATAGPHARTQPRAV